MPKKNYQAQIPTEHGKLPEMDWFESNVGKVIVLTTLSGKTITGALVSYSNYAVFIQESPEKYPVMYFKHGLLSLSRA